MHTLGIQVRNRADGTPVPEASVILDGAFPTRTDERGRATLEMPWAAPSGEAYHSVIVFSPQYRPYYLRIHHAALVNLGFRIDASLEACPPPPADGWGWGMEAVKARTAHELSPLPVKVGILDVGIDRGHPCLHVAGGLCVAAGTDDRPWGPVLGHGTFSAGLIGGYRCGDVGIQGVVPGTALYDIQALHREENGASSSAIVAGVEWAVANGIQVLNLGVGSRLRDPVEEDVYRRAWEAGVVLVAAAGNTDSDDREVMFPARYPTTLAVTAVGRVEDAAPGEEVAVSTGGRLFFPRFNCCGPQVDVAAPGVEICSILPALADGRVLYEYGTGTSEAACFVSAAAAVVLATHPELTRERGPETPEAVRRIVRQGAQPLGFEPAWQGAGLLDVSRCL